MGRIDFRKQGTSAETKAQYQPHTPSISIEFLRHYKLL